MTAIITKRSRVPRSHYFFNSFSCFPSIILRLSIHKLLRTEEIFWVPETMTAFLKKSSLFQSQHFCVGSQQHKLVVKHTVADACLSLTRHARSIISPAKVLGFPNAQLLSPIVSTLSNDKFHLYKLQLPFSAPVVVSLYPTFSIEFLRLMVYGLRRVGYLPYSSEIAKLSNGAAEFLRTAISPTMMTMLPIEKISSPTATFGLANITSAASPLEWLFARLS